MNFKVKLLKQKWLFYNTKAKAYNEILSPEAEMATPSLEEVKSMDLSDHFWNMGALTHPDEPLAVDLQVQEGILAFLTLSCCQEELSRVAREAHQASNGPFQKPRTLESFLNYLKTIIHIYTAV
jgi:hypothetical protein